jgi:hypothetical protein
MCTRLCLYTLVAHWFHCIIAQYFVSYLDELIPICCCASPLRSHVLLCVILLLQWLFPVFPLSHNKLRSPLDIEIYCHVGCCLVPLLLSSSLFCCTCLADGFSFAVLWFSLCLAGCCTQVYAFYIAGFFSLVAVVIYVFLKSVSKPASLCSVLVVACVTFQFVDVQHL